MEDGFSSYSSLYDTTSLLQFCNDDSASASSTVEVSDRIASLEQRVQIQEDEIQLLKSALADVVRRLNVSEEQHAMQTRKGPTKARPLSQTLPLRNAVNSEAILPKKPTGSLPSPSGTRKDIVPLGSKSNVKRTNSTERISPGGRRESAGDSKVSRNRAGSTSSSTSSKKNSESRPKEPMFSAGKRRVTHCKVTVQVLLASHLSDTFINKTELWEQLKEDPESSSSEYGQLASNAPKTLPLPLSRSPSQGNMTFPRSPSVKSPKSTSGYFQLCY